MHWGKFNQHSNAKRIEAMYGPKRATAFLAGVPSNWEIEQIADVNGNGKTDVIWQNANETVAVWPMNGTVIETFGFPGGVFPEWEIKP